jgi:hypothetical protein
MRFSSGPAKDGYTARTCQAACPGYRYFGLKNGNGQTGTCVCDNDPSYATKLEAAPNCDQTGGSKCMMVYEQAPWPTTVHLAENQKYTEIGQFKDPNGK